MSQCRSVPRSDCCDDFLRRISSNRDHRELPSAIETTTCLVHPHQLEVRDFASYSLVIDARSPHEYAEDHIPGAVNLPVVDDDEFAEVGIQHKTDKHAAYLIGVEYSLRNIAEPDQAADLALHAARSVPGLLLSRRQTQPSMGRQPAHDRLRRGRAGGRLEELSPLGAIGPRGAAPHLQLPGAVRTHRVRQDPRCCTRYARPGEQVLELEELAHHRGSLLGDLPGDPQPTQKLFDSALLDEMRRFDVNRTVWVEAESKKIGDLQLPESLCEAMHRSPTITIETPMSERVRLWREDYPHFAADPQAMVRKLEPLKPLVGKETLAHWMALAAEGRVDELFESVMTRHYDPCYARSTRRNFGPERGDDYLRLESLAPEGLAAAIERLNATAAR